MSDVLRIIDANANRAREAARVLEDAARFLLNDRALAEACKQVRHELSAALHTLENLELHRDTAGDVGTQITNESEQARRSTAEVVAAAGSRLAEALRAIEEYSKLLDPNVARAIEQLRYRSYTLHTAISERLPAKASQWRVCLLLSEALCTQHGWRDVAQAAIEAGVDCVQMREKSMDDRGLLQRAEELRALTAGRCALVINDRADIALLSEADGVHLGQDDLPVRAVRALAGRRLLIGVSTHDEREAEQAVRDGADYCGVGAMFASPLKPQREPSGPAFLRAFVKRWPHQPQLAIGGITPANVDGLIEAGCRGVAVSSAICSAADPGEVIARLRATLVSANSGLSAEAAAVSGTRPI